MPHRTGPARCLSSPGESCRVSSFIEQASFAMHAAPEALRQIVHQHEVDQQQRIRFLLEIEVKPRPLSPVDLPAPRSRGRCPSARSCRRRAREPNSQIRSTAGCSASRRASSRITSRRGKSAGRDVAMLRLRCAQPATIAQIAGSEPRSRSLHPGGPGLPAPRHRRGPGSAGGRRSAPWRQEPAPRLRDPVDRDQPALGSRPPGTASAG